MTTKFWRNHALIWAAIGFALYLVVCFGGCNPAKGATWTFTVPASIIKDTYIKQYSPNTSYEFVAAGYVGNNYQKFNLVVGSPKISDSLTAHGGTLDSFKIVWPMSGMLTYNKYGDTMSVYWNALKVIPAFDALSPSWNYSDSGSGIKWQTAGALGANDQYTPRESDGIHVDSVIVDTTWVANAALTLWGNPAHASSEYWIIRGTVLKGNADFLMFFRTVEYGSYMPSFTFYGTTGAAATVTYTAKTMVGVKK